MIIKLLCALNLAVLLLWGSGCGGVSDTTDTDTHVLEVTLIDYFDGRPAERIEKDLGFDRDAYLAAVEETEANLGMNIDVANYEISDFGISQQALTQTGRYGIDSQASANSTETRCPNPPYTGCASCNPNGNYCQAAHGKTQVYGLDTSFTNWSGTFGTDLAALFNSGLQANNAGLNGWSSSWSSTPNVPKYKLQDSQQYAGPAVTTNVLAPITIAAGNGARMRKYTADAQGWRGIITTNFTLMYANGIITNGMSQNSRNNTLRNILQHEDGHMKGLGHRPVFSGEARNTMALNAGLNSFIYQFMSDQKQELNNYVP